MSRIIPPRVMRDILISKHCQKSSSANIRGLISARLTSLIILFFASIYAMRQSTAICKQRRGRNT
uniref:Uncharacterized protein n=1 Tax=Siphoviridae sp. ctwuP1 TaxID=2827972 RepID=A0A8S5TAL3_9CAUD|nr:MAG TPA: hypothetical protein [Siphoviridae sp. ctwuP1]